MSADGYYTLPLKKYYSIDYIFNMCGECCIDPKYYAIYMIFEPGLTNATDNTPCADFKYTVFNGTVTHGVPGILSVTLDLYNPTNSSNPSN